MKYSPRARFSSSLFAYAVIIFVSCLPLLVFFSTSNLIHTHDGLVHLPRIAAYYKALTDGQFPVRWAGDLNYGYGMPLFNFIYQLPYLIASLFLFLGFGLVNAFKISLSLSFLLSGISMFGFLSAFLKDNKKAFLGTILYQFATFHLVELLVRGSFGEVYTYAFLPLVLWALTLFNNKQSKKSFLFISFATFLLILSHNAISLVFFALAVFFLLVFSHKKKTTFLAFCSLVLGLGLSAFYWVPAVLEHKYTYGDLFMKDLYRTHFAPLQQFFLPNITYSKELQTGGIAVQFGLFHLLGIFVAIVFLLTRRIDRNEKKVFIFAIFLTFIALFFMQPVSKLLWEKISLLRQFQFPWRFSSIVVFTSSLTGISFIYLSIFKNRIIYAFLIVSIIGSTVFYWQPHLGFDRINEQYYWNFPLNTTYYGETDTIWSAGPAHAYPKARVEVIGGKGTISHFVKKSSVQSFLVHAETQIQIVSHTQYFPGWRVYSDGKTVPIEFQDQHWRGEVVFMIPKGDHIVKIIFGETLLRFLADLISLISFVMLLIIAVSVFKNKYEK